MVAEASPVGNGHLHGALADLLRAWGYGDADIVTEW